MGGRGSYSMGGRGISPDSVGSFELESMARKTRLTRDDLSKSELAAADEYIEDKFLPEYEKRFGHGIGAVGLVRAAQQGKDFKNEEKYKVMGGKIESVIKRGETDSGIIYRGVRLRNSEFKKYKEGFIFNQNGTSSWSSSDGKALEYAIRADVGADVNVMFRMVSGGKAADIGGISKLHEGEWWVSKDRKMKAIKDPYSVNVWGNKIWIIDVEGL